MSTIGGGHHVDLSMSVKGRKRWLWDDDEKHRIVAQTRVPGVSVSECQHADFPFGGGHAPLQVLLVHLNLDSVQMGLHLGAPAVAFGVRDFQIPDKRHLLFVLDVHALDEECDADRSADRKE